MLNSSNPISNLPDKQLIRQRFNKSAASYANNATVQQQVARQLAALIRQYIHGLTFNRVLEFGCGSGFFSRLLVADLTPDKLWLNDLVPNTTLATLGGNHTKINFSWGDIECIPLPKELDLIASSSALQWLTCPTSFFTRCKLRLKKSAWLAFSTYGKNNLAEIKELTGLGLNYLSSRQLASALTESGFKLQHLSRQHLSLKFKNATAVLKHLQLTGVNSLDHNFRWSKQKLTQFNQEYATKFGDEKNLVTLSYEPIYCLAQKI